MLSSYFIFISLFLSSNNSKETAKNTLATKDTFFIIVHEKKLQNFSEKEQINLVKQV
jgi:hypothetical protein